jgi:hypothetical protein
MAVHIAFLRFRSVGRPTLDCAWLSVALILCQYVLYIYLRLFSMSIGFRYCHRYSTRTRTYVQYHPPKSSASTVTSPVDTSCKSCILKVPTPPPIRDPRQHPWHSLLVGRTPRTLSAFVYCHESRLDREGDGRADLICRLEGRSRHAGL